MKKYLCSFLFLLIALASSGQSSCCMSAAHTSEQAMLNDPAFIAAHADPLPLEYMPAGGGMISFDTPDGNKSNAFYAKKGDGKKVIFMFHEWWGLNNYIKREAERLSELTGYSVLALDLFDGAVATKAEDAAKLSSGANEERIRAIIAGAITFSGQGSMIQTIGWCFGGKWSLQAALQAGPNTMGCVMYYGTPETDKNRLEKISFPVLGIFATKDDFVTPEVVREFQDNMKRLNKNLMLHNYEAVHAFANPSNPNHDAKAAEDAMNKSIRFLQANFSTKK